MLWSAQVNRGSAEVGAAVLRTLRKRLTHRDPAVQVLVLTLLEALMKNCATAFHEKVHSRKIVG